MLAPLQITDFYLLDLDLKTNADFDPAANPEPFRIGFSVRGESVSQIVPPEHAEDPDSLPVGQTLDIETRFETDEPDEEGAITGHVQLIVRVNRDLDAPRLSPHNVEAHAVGLFYAANIPVEPEEQQHVLRIIRANSAAMVYGSLRAIVLQALRMTPHPGSPLPSLSFQQIVEKEIEIEEAQPKNQNET